MALALDGHPIAHDLFPPGPSSLLGGDSPRLILEAYSLLARFSSHQRAQHPSCIPVQTFLSQAGI